MMSASLRLLVVSAIVLVVGFSAFPRAAAADHLDVNDVVVVATDWLNLRSDAGTDGAIRETLRSGIRLMIKDGPRDDDGWTWYKVAVLGDSDEAPLTGWVVEDYIVLESDSGGFDSAGWVRVVDGPVNLRDAAGLDGDVLDTLATGEVADIITASDLVKEDGYTWIHVSQDNGETGWLAIDFLDPLNSDPGGSVSGFDDAQGVRVVDGPINVRRGPGLDQTIVGQLSVGAEVPVDVSVSDIETADGYDWIAIRFGNGIPGYVATDFLEPLSYSPNLGSSDALAPFVDAEGAFVTDGPLYLRAEPGTGSEILLTLDEGDYLWIAQPVIENTATVGDYVWVLVDVAGETGWVAIDFITAAG
jgi:uncharacterized protein YgiM (DUF1202 family)